MGEILFIIFICLTLWLLVISIIKDKKRKKIIAEKIIKKWQGYTFSTNCANPFERKQICILCIKEGYIKYNECDGYFKVWVDVKSIESFIWHYWDSFIESLEK